MKLERVELRRIGIPLATPFRTSLGLELDRDILILRADTSEGPGWGECVAMPEPGYSEEYLDGAAHVIQRFLLPAVAALDDLTPARAAAAMAAFPGNPMAKATVEMAVMDAWLRARRSSYADHLGAVRSTVESGVSVGIADTIDQLLAEVSGYVDQGYRRIKLKIEPGWDLEPVRAIRERFPDIALQADANAAYTFADARHLAALDAFDLVMLEQPLGTADVRDHAALARMLRTPICLDESITSARSAADAIALGACAIVNIKAGRVGGYLEARRIHDVCAAHSVPVWCGGMLETGLGQAANLALAALPGFTMPADIAPSARYFATDVTAPITMSEGRIAVPDGPGLGLDPIPEILEGYTTDVVTITRFG
ncbi:Mandelate racemase/muconate lactonizing protein [Catenulispora acidiphila DSM 44928]|uniref:o-succinylbenzoate synthase n=1 Tax=Catenulispora acidiphila (strain DSM 44928 / JCM 14897 / NBRC 102108 / NRRL B-24433 / ID139908) TaxID=479433 RepID=C7Q4V3_CATAD|nr:o-succinylbenzoate synthase [Catenulispora acidiphila]ACU73901.1 Mandelate racemase/muconate lactonizing protein [Catenulispora acidiphila DSM 44928]